MKDRTRSIQPQIQRELTDAEGMKIENLMLKRQLFKEKLERIKADRANLDVEEKEIGRQLPGIQNKINVAAAELGIKEGSGLELVRKGDKWAIAKMPAKKKKSKSRENGS